MIKTHYWRGLDFYNPLQKHTALIVGVGHVGSMQAFALAKLGVQRLTLVDFDEVEDHNLPHQFLLPENGSKVENIKKALNILSPETQVEVFNDRYEKVTLPNHFFNLICPSVDSLEVRHRIWDDWKDSSDIFIDIRTGGQFANVYSIPTADYSVREYYEESFDTPVVQDLPCTGRGIIDVSMIAGGITATMFRLWSRNNLSIFHLGIDLATGLTIPYKHTQSEEEENED